MQQISPFHPAMLDMVLPVSASETPPYNGTAFLYCKRLQDGSVIGFVVTNKHVIEGIAQTSTTGVVLHVNLAQGGSITLTIPASSWTLHDSADVAILPVGFPFESQHLMRTRFMSDLFYVPRDAMKDQGIDAGNNVVIVGFPLGRGSYADINYPFVRQGIISQIQPWFDGNSDSIIIDANAYPGSSGSPVFVRQGETGEIRLLGVIRGYIPYRDALPSAQTGQTTLITQENSGLAYVIPVEFIEETIEKQMRQ